MKILVTGGGGFIGTHVAMQLANAGHQVTSLSRSPPRQISVFESHGVAFFEGAFNDVSILDRLLPSVDVVIHLAWDSIPTTHAETFASEVETNIVGSIELLNACVRHDIKKFIFVSSGGTVYGVPQYSPIDEDHPLDPISSYGIGKVAIEKYLHLYANLTGLDYTVFRISNAYGPYQNLRKGQGVVGIWLAKIQTGAAIEIWGDGEVVRDYIYVTDIARIIAGSVETALTRRIYNLGSGTGTSLKGILDQIRSVTGVDFEVTYRSGRKIDVPLSVLSVERLKAEMDLFPLTTLEAGIRNVWDWLNGPEAPGHLK